MAPDCKGRDESRSYTQNLIITVYIFLLLSPAPLHASDSAPAAQTFTLQDCYRLALKRSEEIAIRKEAVEKVTADFFNAAGEAFGDVNFIIKDTRQDRDPGSGSDAFSSSALAFDRRERSFEITQPLFQGFKTIGAVTGAGSLKKQRREEKIRAEQLLFLDVANAFYGTLRYKEETDIVRKIRSLLEERMAELAEREQIGRSRPSEVVTAKARMKRTEADLADARGLLIVTRYLLEFLTGTDIEPGMLQDEESPKEHERLEVVLEWRERRPDVLAAKQAEKAAAKNIVIAQSGLWPEITFENNNFVHREGAQRKIAWDLLFQFTIPLSRGGENMGKIKEAWGDWKTAKLNYSAAKRTAELEIKQAYQNWISALERSQALEEAVVLSEENLEIQKEEYSRNLVSNLDVLEAVEQLHETSREANTVRYEAKEHFWKLQVAAGQCCEG
jgi:outer membrane protein